MLVEIKLVRWVKEHSDEPTVSKAMGIARPPFVLALLEVLL